MTVVSALDFAVGTFSSSAKVWRCITLGEQFSPIQCHAPAAVLFLFIVVSFSQKTSAQTFVPRKGVVGLCRDNPDETNMARLPVARLLWGRVVYAAHAEDKKAQ